MMMVHSPPKHEEILDRIRDGCGLTLDLVYSSLAHKYINHVTYYGLYQCFTPGWTANHWCESEATGTIEFLELADVLLEAEQD
jgi:hypothetical protein